MVRNLRASLEKVLTTKTGDEMSAQRYDILSPAVGPGGLEERHWLPINTPVVGEERGVHRRHRPLRRGVPPSVSGSIGGQKQGKSAQKRLASRPRPSLARQAIGPASVDQQPQTLHDIPPRFRAIDDNALDAMLIADDAGTIIDANVAATVLFGRDRADILMARTSASRPSPTCRRARARSS